MSVLLLLAYTQLGAALRAPLRTATRAPLRTATRAPPPARAKALCAIPVPTSPTRPALAVRRDLGNTTVIIQGVLHGATSSADAVQATLDAASPSVVVLELCASRWRSMASDDATFDTKRVDVGDEYAKVLSGARAAFARRGAGAGTMALALGTVYALSQLAGFRPGVEFRVPLRWAEANGADVVLGDKDVVETMASVYRGPDDGARGSRARDTARGLRALAAAIAGDGGDGTISLWRDVLDDSTLRAELATLAGAVAAAAAAVEVSLTVLLGGSYPSIFPAAAAAAPSVPPEAIHAISAANGAVALLSVVLSVDLLGRIGANVIDARDEFLADATRRALDLPTARGSTVLVVVGALHVNGIASRLE